MGLIDTLHDIVFHDTEKLFKACKNGDVETARKAIKYANLNKLNEYGEPPLFVAVEKGRVEVVKVILEDGRTNPNLTNSHGPKVRIPSHDDEYTPLIYALAYLPDTEIAKLLINDPRTNVNIKTKVNGYTALEFAVERNDEELVEMLLKRGADPNLHVDKYGSVALRKAIEQVAPTPVGVITKEKLIEIGGGVFAGNIPRYITIDVEMTTQNGVRIVKMLLDAGAKVTPKTLEFLEKHKKKEEKYWQKEIDEKEIPPELGQKALEDLRKGIEEVRKMLIQRLEKEKSLPSIREEGQKTKVHS
jgi:ankyrin repeat protein